MESETLKRLVDQIDWYDKKSLSCQSSFKRLKLLVVIMSALIPLISPIPDVPRWVLGLIGATVVVLEGAQQLYKFQENWIGYRSTCETLKHEKFLFLGNAGPYKISNGAEVLLAERIESLVSQEHAKWASAQSGLVSQNHRETVDSQSV